MRHTSRRAFLASLPAIGGAAATVTRAADPARDQRWQPTRRDSFDPWLEIDAAAIRDNAREMSRRAGGRPILAVVKNNAYGLSDTMVGPLLDALPEVAGIACVDRKSTRLNSSH